MHACTPRVSYLSMPIYCAGALQTLQQPRGPTADAVAVGDAPRSNDTHGLYTHSLTPSRCVAAKRATVPAGEIL